MGTLQETLTLEFRRATAADVAAIVALVHSAYRGDASRAGWTTESDLLDGQRTDAAEVHGLISGELGDARIVLGYLTNDLVASMGLVREAGGVYLGMIAVRPDRQGRGIGRALLAEAERIARSERLGSTLRMSVIAQRPALIAWYGRRGFRPTGEHSPFPYGDARFGLPRRPDLYFVTLERRLG